MYRYVAVLLTILSTPAAAQVWTCTSEQVVGFQPGIGDGSWRPFSKSSSKQLVIRPMKEGDKIPAMFKRSTVEFVVEIPETSYVGPCENRFEGPVIECTSGNTEIRLATDSLRFQGYYFGLFTNYTEESEKELRIWNITDAPSELRMGKCKGPQTRNPRSLL